jgi:ribosomal-protein-alanine N-acetyltransferase
MIEIVPAGIVHARLMAAIHRVCFAEPWDEAAIAQLVGMPGSFALLGHSKAEGPAAMVLARVAADEAEILTLAVLPPFRRKGAGQALVMETASRARAAGAKALFLEAAADNQAALALYGKVGFVQAGRRPRYYPDGTDAVLLRLEL